MKIVLLEDVFEQHVRRSLARALKARGHEVVEMPPVWHGHDFATDAADLQRIFAMVETVGEEKPDLLLNFRKKNLPKSARDIASDSPDCA